MNRHSILSRRLSVFALICFSVSPGFAGEYRGRLEPQVRQGTRVFVYVNPAPADVLARLPEKPAADAHAWVPRNAYYQGNRLCGGFGRGPVRRDGTVA